MFCNFLVNYLYTYSVLILLCDELLLVWLLISLLNYINLEDMGGALLPVIFSVQYSA